MRYHKATTHGAAELINQPSSSSDIRHLLSLPYQSCYTINIWEKHVIVTFQKPETQRREDSFIQHVSFLSLWAKVQGVKSSGGSFRSSSGAGAQAWRHNHISMFVGEGLCETLVLVRCLTVSLIVEVNTACLISGCWLTAPACKIPQILLWKFSPLDCNDMFLRRTNAASLNDWRPFMKRVARLSGLLAGWLADWLAVWLTRPCGD